MSAVKLQNVSYRYEEGDEREIPALREISFEVRRGDFVSIIGANGSGKTSVAKHVNALLRPLTGRVFVLGMDTKDDENLWEIRRQTGLVFQNPDNQMVATTVEEDVVFGMENLGVPHAEMEHRMKEALSAVGMWEYRKREPYRLSGGQKQRVAIAGILAMEPSVLILDEATSMLDPRGRQALMTLVHRLRREKRLTVIHITHHLEEVLASDYVMVMHRGELVMQGSPSEVFQNTELLREMGLVPPLVVELRDRLLEKGFQLDGSILEEDRLVEALWKSLSNR